jgi:hypothetical protein
MLISFTKNTGLLYSVTNMPTTIFTMPYNREKLNNKYHSLIIHFILLPEFFHLVTMLSSVTSEVPKFVAMLMKPGIEPLTRDWKK